MKHWSLVFLLGISLLLGASCGKEPEPQPLPQPVKVTGITLNSTSLSLNEGETADLVATISPKNATNQTVIWSSSNGSVASVNGGKVTALKAGETTITAKSDEGGFTATCSITVNSKTIAVTSISLSKDALTLTEGESETLIATVKPDNATDKSITWSSSDASIATVNQGKVTAVKEGSVTITAKAGDKSATCVVSVTKKLIEVESIELSDRSLNLTEGGTATLVATVKPDNASDKTVIWNSSDNSIVSVSSTGLVNALKVGSVTVTASCGGKSATCSITVTSKTIPVTGVELSPTALSLTEGGKATLTATVLPGNATDKGLTWKSSDSSIASVSSEGVVTAIKEGRATITVTTIDGGKTATCSVVVNKEVIHVTSITLNRSSLSLIKGESFRLEASVSPSNATFGTITWSSSSSSVATVDSSGKVSAVSAGTATITAKADGKSTTCKVTVTDTVNGGNEGTGETIWD